MTGRRVADETERFSLTLPRETVEWLDGEAERRSVPRATIVRELIVAARRRAELARELLDGPAVERALSESVA